MIRRLTIVVTLLCFFAPACAQLRGGPERAALRNLGKHKWAKAQAQLRKLLAKQPAHAAGNYLLSVWFFSDHNPAFDHDSAYFYVNRSLEDWKLASQKDRDKWQRIPLDSLVLTQLRARIDSAVFRHLKNVNTEEGYIRFLREHPHAAQRPEARRLRDEVAYLNALEQNTHEAFFDFLHKYPEAERTPEARKKYERLLFEARTADGKLSSLEHFLHDHPDTPFRPELETRIFELFTLSGEPERFISFINQYPASREIKKARDILFHILHEKGDPQSPGPYMTDSLEHVKAIEDSYLVPFLRNGKFGLMDKTGREVIGPEIDDLDEEYRCGNITEDVIVLKDRIVSRDNHTIYSGSVSALDDIGSGFLLVRSDSCAALIHKSGFYVDSCAQDARVLGNRLLAVKHGNGWAILSLAGRPLMPDVWDDVLVQGNVVLAEKGRQWKMLPLEQLKDLGESQKIILSEAYESIDRLTDGLLLVKTRGFEAVLNQSLEEVIPFNQHQIQQTFFGFRGKSADGYSIYDKTGKHSSHFDEVLIQEPWAVVKKNGAWRIFDATAQAYASPAYDSVRFEGPFLFGFETDSVTVHLSARHNLRHAAPFSASFIPGKDSAVFLAATIDGKKAVYNQRGNLLFTGAYDQVQYSGRGLFIVSRKEKRGLINSLGRIVLPLEYDAIGSATNEVISVLKAMKFGLFNIHTQKLIKPQYDKNLQPYATNRIAAFRDGRYGFIDWDNKHDGSFEFEEIQVWNDTAALVKKNAAWWLYHITGKHTIGHGLKDLKMIRETLDEKVMLARTESAYGVLSNTRGTIIPLTFTDLVNVGSREEPFYFTEKHVPEAAIFVVIYYDQNGKFIRREVYEEPDDYEKIYCPQQ